MPDLVLTTLKFAFLALLYLFVARALRVIWLDLAGPRSARGKAAASSSAPAPVARPGPIRHTAKPGARPRSITVTEEGLPAKSFQLAGAAVTIGRADECTVVLHDTYVSQLHTKIFPKDGQWHVMDCGSTNGTFLNRVKIGDPVPVAPGDEVRLGKTIVEVRGK